MKAFFVLALLVSGPALAADELSLCTNYAETVITGGMTNCGSFKGCTAEKWKEKAAQAGFSCEPIAPYIEIAKIRLGYKAEKAASAPPPPEPYRLPERRFEMTNPKRTTCHTTGDTTTCTEN